MNITETIDVVELLVVVIGIIGVPISLIMVAVIQASRKAVRVSGKNGINKRLTNSDLRNELSRTYKLIGFLLIGVLSMMAPPPVREGTRLTGDIFKWMLVSWEILAVVNSLWGYVDHKRNIDALRIREEGMDAARLAEDTERNTKRDIPRDIGRDLDRDTQRDQERDVVRDLEHDKATEGAE